MTSIGSMVLSVCMLVLGCNFLMEQALKQESRKCIRRCPPLWVVSHERNTTTACLAPCLAPCFAPTCKRLYGVLRSVTMACHYRCTALLEIVPCIDRCVRRRRRDMLTKMLALVKWKVQHWEQPPVFVILRKRSADTLVATVGRLTVWLQ